MAAKARPRQDSLAAGDRLPELSSTKHRDYILSDYPPRVNPAGRLHSASVYRFALRQGGLLAATWPLVDTLVEALGPDETVWGMKYSAAGVSSELYFYNRDRNPLDNPKSVTRLARLLRPHLAVPAKIDERLPYFMCSLDLAAADLAAGRSPGFRVYLSSGDASRVECGFSYLFTRGGEKLENHYWFYSAADARQRADALARLRHSPRAAGGDETLAPDTLLDCHTICYAVKPDHDGLYFSRLTGEQVVAFLESPPVRAPAAARAAPLAALLRSHRDDFAHLRWDLGYDFRRAAGRGPIIEKIGLYGVV